MKKFWSEFKAFIMRGNILDMAVGVIIGGAFSAIVTAFTNGIIMPLVNLALSGSEGGLDSAFTFLKKVYVDGEISLEKSIYIDWGAFITAILNFLIIALTLFVIIKVAMASSKVLHKAKEDMKPKVTKQDKKEMKAAGINTRNKAAVEAYMQEKARLAAEEEAKAKAEAEANRKPTTEELLGEIVELLKTSKKTK